MDDTVRKPSILDLSGGNLAVKWDTWIKDFEWYLQGIGKEEADEKERIGKLMSAAGPNAQSLFDTFNLSDANKKVYEEVKKAFKAYCNPRKRILYERHVFQSAKQEDSESIDQYLTKLRMLIKNCEYKDKEEQLRDRFVFGLKDNGPGGVMERLFEKQELTIEQAVDIARAAEASKAQMKMLRSSNAANAKKEVHAMSKAQKEYNCKRCAQRHGPKNCPAYGETCNFCKGKHHFAKCCFSKKKQEKKSAGESHKGARQKHKKKKKKFVHEVNEDTDSSSEDDFFLGALYQVNSMRSKREWTSIVSVNGHSIKMKLDCGSEANVMPKTIYDKIHPQQAPGRSRAKLTTYSGEKLKVVGKSLEMVEHKGKFYPVEFIVVDHKAQPILGIEACDEMKLVQKIDALSKKQNLLDEYEEVFTGMGEVPGMYHITLKQDVPPVIHAPRRVPHALRKELQEELKKMEAKGIIKRVTEPTDWVNSLVVVRKPQGGVRVCIDPKDLNRAIKREHHPLTTHEEITAKLAGATVFSTLDAEKAFYQVKLDEESQKLLTFNTPFGRYCYLRMPMGISSASEVYQNRMQQCLDGLEGVEVMLDDILVWGKSEEEHDQRLKAALDRIKACNIKLNKKKCQIKQPEVKYLGHRYSKEGVKIDESKVKAVLEMPEPEDAEGVSRFLGMLNYLSRFIPNMSQKTAPVRELLSKEVEWHWGPEQEKGYEELKKILCEAPVLAYYDPNKELIIQVDASSKGIGCALIQDSKPIAYASKALTKCQQAYAQIEKELLAIVVGCTKFEEYIIGRTARTIVQTDHKPLESIVKKPLYLAPARLQKMLIQLQRYPEIEVEYIKGKDMIFADALSRAYLQDHFEEEYKVDMIHELPISSSKYEELVEATENDSTCKKLKELILCGWPEEKSELSPDCQPYWNYRDEMVTEQGLIFKGWRILVPAGELRRSAMEKLHESHQGIVRTKQRARDVIFWPCINKEIEEMIKKCSVCLENQKQNAKEPMKSHEIPRLAWMKVGADLFSFKGKEFVVVMDYYSKFIEVRRLQGSSSKAVINALKSIFATQGIPEEVVSDNGPCFSSSEFASFARNWEFEHTTSSPMYPRSNGQAESGVKIVKSMMTKSEDPYLALLEYRTTPIPEIGSSPSQLLNSRRLRTRLPVAKALLEPQVQSGVHKKLSVKQKVQKKYHDRHAKKKESEKLDIAEPVRIHKDGRWKPAIVTEKLPHNSYTVVTQDGGEYRRTRSDLYKSKEMTFVPKSNVWIPEDEYSDPDPQHLLEAQSTPAKPSHVPSKMRASPTSAKPGFTKSGRSINPPKRLISEC